LKEGGKKRKAGGKGGWRKASEFFEVSYGHEWRPKKIMPGGFGETNKRRLPNLHRAASYLTRPVNCKKKGKRGAQENTTRKVGLVCRKKKKGGVERTDPRAL